VAALAPAEIKALARIVGELDYYQLLHLRREASPREVKGAYHETSRSFHPDASRHLEPDLRAAVEEIAKRVSEAYCVLRDPLRRRAYDERLSSGAGPRMQLAEAQAAADRRHVEEREGRTPQGRQFFNLARAAVDRGDLEGAMRNLQTALTFEPENPGFRERLSQVRKRLGYAR
jgi:DnaJ-class molecular chaperone